MVSSVPASSSVSVEKGNHLTDADLQAVLNTVLFGCWPIHSPHSLPRGSGDRVGESLSLQTYSFEEIMEIEQLHSGEREHA